MRAGTSIIDMATGMWSVIGVLVALLQRRESGKGSSIDTSLYESALGWMCYHAANFQASGELPKRQGSGAAMIVPYRGYASKDGFIVIAAGNDKLFAALGARARSSGVDRRSALSHQPGSGEKPSVLYGWIEEIIAARTTAEWTRAGRSRRAQCADTDHCPGARPSADQGAGYSAKESAGRHHIGRAAGVVRRRASRIPRAPPALGADTEEIFGEGCRYCETMSSPALSVPKAREDAMNVMQSVPEEAVQLTLGETYPEIRDLVRRICSDFPGSYWRKLDDEQAYPTEFVAALTKAGLLAALIPEEYGGLGLPLGAAAATLEEIHASGCNAGACHAQMYIMGTLLRHGSAEQKQRYLPEIAAGRLRLQAFGVTEPTTGTDTTKLKTRAERGAITTSSTARKSGRRARCNRI